MFNLAKYSAEQALSDQARSIYETGDLEDLGGQFQAVSQDIQSQARGDIGTTEEAQGLFTGEEAQDLVPIYEGVRTLLLFRDDADFTDEEKQLLEGRLRSAHNISDASTALFKDIQAGKVTDQELAIDDTAKMLARTRYEGEIKPDLAAAIAAQRRTITSSKQKTAQMQLPQSNFPRTNNFLSILPVNDIGDFISKFVSIILSGDETVFNRAQSEVVANVSAALEQEAQSAFDSLRTFLGNAEEEEEIASILTKIYGMLPAVQSSGIPAQNEEPVMAKSFNLLKHTSGGTGHKKEAYLHVGDAYLIYGPTEKRVCPKLRGRGGGKVGGSDVVSEEICRFHCLDGIVIDDNKTICGEALWRGSVMDKFSREYVDADGKITGGYLNKRFEINRNVPEENKMRLKPGETRKPRPPAWGVTESRMQDMRNKEGQARGYRPAVNTGQPFDWQTDVDQNNVEQPQAERDRREEAMGHQTVQYTDKEQLENNPKLAKTAGVMEGDEPFQLEIQDWESKNLDQTGRYIGEPYEGFPWKPGEWIPTDKRYSAMLEHRAAQKRQVLEKRQRLAKTPSDENRQIKKAEKEKTAEEKSQSFNLKQHKEADSPFDSKTAQSPSFEQEKYDFATGEQKWQNASSAELWGTLRDLEATIKVQEQANREGGHTPKLGYYWDEYHTVVQEIRRRQDEGPGPKQAQAQGTTYKGIHYRANPWAVCKSTVNEKEEPEKFERCIRHVKEQSRTTPKKKTKKKSFNLQQFKTAKKKT